MSQRWNLSVQSFYSFARQRNLTFQETKRTDFFCEEEEGNTELLSEEGRASLPFCLRERTRTRTDTTKDNSVTMVLSQTESRTTAFKESWMETYSGFQFTGLCALLISAIVITIHTSQHDGCTCRVGKVVQYRISTNLPPSMYFKPLIKAKIPK